MSGRWVVPSLAAMVWMTTSPSMAEPAVGEAEAVALARAALSERLNAPEDRIQTGPVEAKDWSDASLGCPEEGMLYAQVVTPGFQVELQVDGKRYDMRVGNGRATVCERKEAGASAEPDVGTMARLSKLARRDLARRLKVADREIRIKSVRAHTWPDEELGCPPASRSTSPHETPGFVIELSHQERTYEYHSDRERVVLCPR